MLRRIGPAAVLVGALATTPLSATQFCYTVGSFAACASAVVTVNAGVTQLQVQIQNLSNQVGTGVYGLSAFGFYYITPPAATGTVTLVSGAQNWINGLPSTLTNPGPAVGAGQAVQWLGGARANTNIGPFYQQTRPSNWSLVGCGSFSNLNPSVNSTCASPITFTFSLTNTSNFQLSQLNFAMRGVAITHQPNVNGVGDAFNCFPTNTACLATTTTNAVPEPATLTLLAVGLVGMTGAGIIRHRRRPSRE